jgi:hypothetical protein
MGKISFTRVEDDTIVAMVEAFKTAGVRPNWHEIARYVPGHTNKQVRGRYADHLRPDLVKCPYSNDEKKVALDGYRELGTAWSEISKRLPGRTGNSVKNAVTVLLKREGERPQKRQKPPSFDFDEAVGDDDPLAACAGSFFDQVVNLGALPSVPVRVDPETATPSPRTRRRGLPNDAQPLALPRLSPLSDRADTPLTVSTPRTIAPNFTVRVISGSMSPPPLRRLAAFSLGDPTETQRACVAINAAFGE